SRTTATRAGSEAFPEAPGASKRYIVVPLEAFFVSSRKEPGTPMVNPSPSTVRHRVGTSDGSREAVEVSVGVSSPSREPPLGVPASRSPESPGPPDPLEPPEAPEPEPSEQPVTTPVSATPAAASTARRGRSVTSLKSMRSTLPFPHWEWPFTLSSLLGFATPPAPQPLRGRLLADRPLVETHLQQVRVGPAELRTRLDPQDLADLVPVELRADLVQLFLLSEHLDPLLEVVIGAPQPGGLALVAGGAVRPGEPVQPLKQRPGVGDVAPHRGVGPLAVAVPVETQVQLDEAGDGLGRLLVEAQGLEALGGQLRAHDVVVVEGDPAAGLETPGARLADVVHEGREPQDQVRARDGVVTLRIEVR